MSILQNEQILPYDQSQKDEAKFTKRLKRE